MRYRKLCGLLLLLALITGFFAGCQLAKEESGENGEDRMIGVLITTAYLEPFDFVETGDGNDFVQECGEQMVGESAQEGRLYAALWTKTLTDEETGKAFTTREYVFEEVDGIAYFAANVPATEEEEGFLGTSTDDAISEGRFDVFEGDEEQRITLEGTIYLSADMGAGRTYYINPVFQSEEGSVYATAGDGIMVDGVQTEGNAWSQTMDSTVTLTENGESKKQAFSISLSLSVMDCPEEIVLLQMDEQSNVIKLSLIHI